jgi:hypothetical protein
VGMVFHPGGLAEADHLFEHLAERSLAHIPLNIPRIRGAAGAPAIFLSPNGRGRPSSKYRAA